MSPDPVKPALSPQEIRAHIAKRKQQYRALGLDMEAQYHRVAQLIGPVHGSVLDVGTGKGRLTVELARIAPRVVSIDPSDEDRAFARTMVADARVGERVTLIAGVGESLPFADAAFAAVVSHQALHHFETPDRILREMVRVAQPGGIVLASDFDSDGFDVVQAVHRSEGRHHPVGGWPADRAAQFLRGLGCDVALQTGPMMRAAVGVRRGV